MIRSGSWATSSPGSGVQSARLRTRFRGVRTGRGHAHELAEIADSNWQGSFRHKRSCQASVIATRRDGQIFAIPASVPEPATTTYASPYSKPAPSLRVLLQTPACVPAGPQACVRHEFQAIGRWRRCTGRYLRRWTARWLCQI